MRLTLGALAALEAELAEPSLVALVERFEQGRFPALMFWRCCGPVWLAGVPRLIRRCWIMRRSRAALWRRHARRQS